MSIANCRQQTSANMENKKNLRAFNLNTLPVLREILRHGSVGKAATALGVSQPALSAALKQLRYHFDDRLIVRSAGLMKLTPKAESLLSPLEDALAAIHDVITPGTGHSKRQKAVIKIASNDHMMILFGGPLSELILRDNVGLLPQFLSAGGHSAKHLVTGEIEYIIAPKFVIVSSNVPVSDLKLINSQHLFSEPMVAIGHQDDLELLKSLTVEEYLGYPHIGFQIDAEQNISMEQAYLSTNSLLQNDIVRFSCYSALLSSVRQTRSIAVVPISFAKMFKPLFDIAIFEPPIALPPVEWTMIWHRRNDNNDQHVQFRKIMQSCVQQMIQPGRLDL